MVGEAVHVDEAYTVESRFQRHQNLGEDAASRIVHTPEKTFSEFGGKN